MPIIKILNRDYQIACGEGEEPKLLALASKLDKRLHNNSKLFKGANEVTLIMLTALMLEDAIQDLEQRNDNSTNQIIDALADRINILSHKLSK